MRKLPLYGKHGVGKFALVDDVDYKKALLCPWFMMKKGYAIGTVEGKPTYLHRFIMNPPAGMDVDHKNGDKLDNQRKNLRVCTRSQNNANIVKPDKYKGVHFDKSRQNFLAYIKLNGKMHYLGRYQTAQEAATAYNERACKIFGEFAQPNKLTELKEY